MMSAEDYLPEDWPEVLYGDDSFPISEARLEAKTRIAEDKVDRMSDNKPYENLKCPSCDGPMASRKGPYGSFWGCKKFPECKGTRDNQGRSKDDRENETRSYNADRQDKETLDGIMRDTSKNTGPQAFTFNKDKK